MQFFVIQPTKHTTAFLQVSFSTRSADQGKLRNNTREGCDLRMCRQLQALEERKAFHFCFRLINFNHNSRT